MASGWLGVLASSLPVAAQGLSDQESRKKEAAKNLAEALIKGMSPGSKVMVRPFARRYTGLPEDVAVELEGLIVQALQSKIPTNMEVEWVTPEDVKRIYSSLDESHFDEDSEELLKSVLRSARADTVIQCRTLANRIKVESLQVSCSVSSGTLVCPDRERDVKNCRGVQIGDVKNSGKGKATFPWSSTDYLNHVFSHVAWKLAKHLPDRLPVGKMKGRVGVGSSAKEKEDLHWFISLKLREALLQAIRERRGLRSLGDDPAEGHDLRWSITRLKKLYLLAVEVYLSGDVKAIETRIIAPTSIPLASPSDEMRLAKPDTVKPDPGGTAGPGAASVEQAIAKRGLERAITEKNYDDVLRYLGELAKLGGPQPPAADYHRGEAEFHKRRYAEARRALKRYVKQHGEKGAFSKEGLDLLLAVGRKDDEAFEQARRSDTPKSYRDYRVSFPDGAHTDESKRLGAAAEKRERDARAEQTDRERQAREAAARKEAERKKREQEDDAAFGEARRADTASAYEAYLSSYPRGRHAGEARSRLRELELAEAERVEVSLELRREERVMVQRGLASLGHEVGGSDGVLGERTRRALRSWQKSKGLAETGYLTREQAEALMAMGREAEFPVGRVFRDCGGCPEMVVVPAGSFEMGSPSSEEGRYDREGPVHRVTMGERFAVGVREVTRGEYRRFVRATGHSAGYSCWTYEDGEWKYRGGWNWEDPGYEQTDGHPVVCVSWEDAKAYVGWLSRETGEEYRLLSEAEWEYVARAGSKGARYWGGSEAGQCGHANGADKEAKKRYGNWRVVSCNDGRVHTAPVGSYGANGFGLHDVLGNVWEWVEDCWNGSYAGAPSDGSAWETGNCGRRVLRGGSWIDGPGVLRSASRYRDTTGDRRSDIGFRVARTLTP